MELLKVPPQNLEAEQAVIGAMMLEPEVGSSVFEILQPEDFYRDNHRLIFSAIRDLFEKGDPIDLVSVAEILRQQGRLEQVGGIATISAIARSVPSVANVEYYAKLVTEKALLRQLIRATSSILERGYEPGEEARVLLEEAEKLILDLSRRRVKDGFSLIRDILLETFEKIEYLYANKGNLTGVPTFFTELDRMTSGWQSTDLVIIAARPSMGKTALALNMAQNAAVRAKVPVAIFSMEMSKEQLVQRVLSSEAKVENEKLKTGKLADQDWTKLASVLGPISEAPMYFDDSTDVSMASIRAKCRKMKLEKNIGVVIIDYLQLMQGKGKENRVQEVSEISRSLKLMARELNIPIIVGSQLSRAVESRTDKRPMLSDLRESGAIEQDADIVMFLYREDYYNPETEFKNISEVIIAKHRNGSVGTIKLMFQPESTTFKNLTIQNR